MAAATMRRPWRRQWLWFAAAVLALAIAVCGSVVPLCPANAPDRLVSPDGAFTLALCRTPMPFAMPGQAGDAPGYAVLRDRDGWIAGVVDIALLRAVDQPVAWTADSVAIPLALELALPPTDRPLAIRALDDAAWRIRAVVGATPHDFDFR
ncbi:MAG: hypothetical protein HY246_19920 [Proteobacteria bacterium]|nr:hypothetical protein [Pseudomonadota bacterium]